MAFDLPLMTPLPLMLGYENGVASDGSWSSGGLPLFSMSASVGLDANAFNAGIASLTASINTLNATVTTLLSSIGSTVDGIATNLSGLGASTNTAATAIDTALDSIDAAVDDTMEAIDDLDDDFETVGTDFNDAAKAIEKAGGDATTAGKDLSSAVEKVSESTKTGTLKFEDFAKAAGKAWTAVKNVAAAAMEIGKALIEPAVAYQQRQRTYEMAFGGIEELASEKMEELVKYTGYYEGVLQGTFARMQSQFMSAGYSQADAIEYSTSAMKLAADAAAAYGISLDDATYKVMSFLRGNTEAGESIGLFATEQSRNAKANDMYGQGWKNLNESERQAVLLAIAQETYGSSGKTGLATTYSESYLVSMANLKQRWADILGKLGTPILEAVSPVLNSLFEKLNTPGVEGGIQSLADGIAAFLQTLSNAIVGILTAVSDNPTAVTDFFAGLTDLFNALSTLAVNALPIVYAIMEVLGLKTPEWKKEEADAATELSGTPVMADDITRSHAALGTIIPLIKAIDRYYDLDLSDTATDDEINAAREEYERLMQDFLASANEDQIAAMQKWLEESGIRSDDENSEWRKGAPGTLPADYRDTLPDAIKNLVVYVTTTGDALRSLPSKLSAAMAAGLSGVTVQVDGVVLGHLVTPHVMANMARDVNFRRNTTTKST